MEKIKIFEAFSGFGSFALTLKGLQFVNPNFDFEIVGISEIDKDAIKAYKTLHGIIRNYGDIRKVKWDKVPDFNLFTYSYPCQSISRIGKKQGMKEGSGTESSLVWFCKDAIMLKNPTFLIMENVKELLSKENQEDFEKWQTFLTKLGYRNYIKVLNAKDYGIPQNRERVFLISIKGEHPSYKFPEPFPLKNKFPSFLDKKTHPKYYVNADSSGVHSRKRIDELIESGVINPYRRQWIDLYSKTAKEDVISTITTRIFGSGNFLIHEYNYQLRKPTPRECFRFMGLDEISIGKLLNLNLKPSKYYHLAGNSIVIDVLYFLFYNLFYPDDICHYKESYPYRKLRIMEYAIKYRYKGKINLIEQIDPITKRVINVFTSVRDAASHLGNINNINLFSNINKACKDPKKRVSGYFFRVKELDLQDKENQ